MMERWKAASILVFLMLAVASLAAQEQAKNPQSDLVLTGDVTGAQNKTYFEVPFNVPAGTHRISVDFHYTRQGAARDARSGYRRSGAFSRRERRQQEPLHHQRDGCDSFLFARRYSSGSVASADLRCRICGRRPCPTTGPRSDSMRATRTPSFAAQPLATRHALVSRRPAHAHRAQRWKCPSQSGRMVPCPLFLSLKRRRRADLTSSPSPTTTPTPNTMRCASCSLTSTACC